MEEHKKNGGCSQGMADCHVAKEDRQTRKGKRKRIFTIPYKPIVTIVEVQGREIRKIRQEAGLTNQTEFAIACGWSPTLQNQYEADGRHEMNLETICKMIRVCNGWE